MKKSLLCLAAGLIIISCSKEKDLSNQNPKNASSLAEITVPQDFNWSSSIKGEVGLTLQHDPEFQTEGRQVWVVNEAGKRLDQQVIHNDHVKFNLSLPILDEIFYYYYPATGDYMKITSTTGVVDFKIHSDFTSMATAGITPFNFRPAKKSTLGTHQVNGSNLLSNGDFASNNFTYYGNIPSCASVSGNGVWYTLDYNYVWDTENGSKVYKAKNNKTSYAVQIVSVTPGDSFAISSDAHGNSAVIIAWYSSSSSYYYGYNWYSRSSYSTTISGSGVVPNYASYAAVIAYVDDKGWVDNVDFATEAAIIDADNDGVEDSQDDFPNDPARAYASHFPTSGYQTLAFEDLWPAMGDYDFNDMVVSTKIDYASDANNDKVDATVTISLDAMGAGASNGLAIRLLNSSKQAFGSNIIASVSGDATLDPDNQNGIIVFDDAKAAQSSYYTNNGEGPDKQPDVFTFTITFNSNIAAQSITPDIYIYRTGERGKEIHLDGFSGSSIADASYYNTKLDYNGTYNTPTGLPWAIEVITANKTFEHPKEKVDILVAYPSFQQWAESGGSNAQNWMQNPVLSKVFDLF